MEDSEKQVRVGPDGQLVDVRPGGFRKPWKVLGQRGEAVTLQWGHHPGRGGCGRDAGGDTVAVMTVEARAPAGDGQEKKETGTRGEPPRKSSWGLEMEWLGGSRFQIPLKISGRVTAEAGHPGGDSGAGAGIRCKFMSQKMSRRQLGVQDLGSRERGG